VPGEELGGSVEPAIAVRAKLLGAFSLSVGGHSAGPWPRPSAKRLCELVLVSPGRKLTRDLACEALFADLGPDKAARALVKALSMARGVLSGLGEPAAGLLQADRANIWAAPEPVLEVDVERHEEGLRAALSMAPGQSRDDRLLAALAEDDEDLLADEPYTDWAIRPRERLEALRQRARLALARGRAGGAGRASREAVVEAWESCMRHDPACEEAAAALLRAYSAQGQRQLVVRTYELCRAALDELGLRPSPALEEVHAAATFGQPGPDRRSLTASPAPAGGPSSLGTAREERKTVSVLFAGVAPPAGATGQDPEDLHEVVAEALAMVITEVEGLGGTVVSVSGGGLQALFGAPETHEDDPERAVRAAFRALSSQPVAAHLGALRIGVETGPAVVGPIGAGARYGYGAVGAVVATAAALQSLAKPSSALVGPATRIATEGLFEWGPTEEVVVSTEAKPLVASYLERPKARASGRQLRLGGRGPLVGRGAELSVLGTAVRDLEAGRGSLVLVVGEPGLGKTRLVLECRKRFMAWVGARTGRLPLWLEGRCASYASTTPYGLYQHLLASWVGVAPDQDQAVVAPALEQALRAVMGNKDMWPGLARMMGLSGGPGLARMSPPELQRETFTSLRAVVSRLVSIGPTVLALEDLHWADPTSLRLTEDLATLVSEGPLLVLATARTDARAEQAGFESGVAPEATIWQHRVELGPLAKEAERELARTLVGDDSSQDVLDNLLRGVEGNPLFLEERYFSMVETGALVRDQGSWRVAPTVGLEVPQVLERLVRSRADRLSPAALEVLRAASVLGQELGLPLLAALCEAGDQLDGALAELCITGLIQEVGNAREPTYQFRHALIQEATYGGMLRPQRRQLHGRAAWALEAVSRDRLDEVAPVLGRHFAAAGEPERAVHYFELAGNHAVGAFANDEAVTSFRSALEIADRGRSGSEVMARTALALRGKLAHLLWRIGRRPEARAVMDDALRSAGPGDSLQSAGLQAFLGQMEIDERHYDAAAAAYDAAEELLGGGGGDKDEVAIRQWLDVMVEGRAQLHLHRKEPELALAVLSEARPVLEARGSPAQKHLFYRNLAWQAAMKGHFRVDEEIIANMRKAAAAAAEGGDESDIAWAALFLGFFLMLRGDLGEAQEQWESSLAVAERSADNILRAANLVCSALVAVRRHDVEAVRYLAPQAVVACEVPLPEFVGAGKGCLAWLAWQDERANDVVTLANEAAEHFRTALGPMTFWKWVYLWPLVAVRLGDDSVGEAVAASRQLLEPFQQRPPDELERVLESASVAWTSERADVARANLTQALELARDLHFF
jgi:class 3 adenylate cyclase/DNA-binding SARP family transcriptional activator/tetratricopeptide (TPR) repeat protein